MSEFMKAGQPWLYDDATGDIVGVRDNDGGTTYLAKYATDSSGNVTGLVGPGGVAIGPVVRHYYPDGSHSLNETLLLGSNAYVEFSAGAILTSAGTYQHTLIRTGNAEFMANANPIPGVTIYCADEVSSSGTGTLRYTHATTSLSWMPPGATTYGAEIDISGVTNAATVAIFTLAGPAAGQALYVYVAPATRTVNLTRTVRVEPVTGAKAVTWSRTSNITTVTETAHQRRVGDFVILFNSTTAMRHGYIAAVTADTWTIADTGTDGTGSARAYGVRNITIKGNGATLDYNKAGLTAALMSNLHSIILNAVSDVVVEHLQVNNTTKYALLLTGYTNVQIDGFSLYRTSSATTNGNSDGPHPLGPGRGLTINHLRGQGGDNLVGIGCSDFYDYVFNCPQYGDLSINDTTIDTVICDNTHEQPIRLYNANGSNWIRNTTVRNVRGTYDTNVDACVAIIMDTMSGGMVDSGQTNVDGLTIIAPDAVRVDGTPSHAFVNKGAGTRRNVRLFNVKPRSCNSTIRATCQVDPGSSMEDMFVHFDGGSFSGALVRVTGTGSVGRLTVRSNGVLNGNNELGGGEIPRIINVDTNTSIVSYLDMADLILDDVSTTGNKLRTIENQGTITEYRINNVRILDGDCLVRHTTTAAAGATLRAENAICETDHVLIFDGGAPGLIYTTNVWQSKVANALVAVNEATARTVRVKSVGCRTGNRFLRNVSGNHTWLISGHGNEPGAGNALVTDAGTPNWRLDGEWDLVTDGALLDATVGNHRAGAQFYNSNAAFGAGIGAYVRGSAAWVRVAS
jgi:hypothetical protein